MSATPVYISSQKILAHPDRVHAWLKGDDPAPINVQICPYDSQCNHACPACVAGFKGFTGSVMPTTTFARLVGELSDMGVRSMTLTGGSEPLLHYDFDELVEIASAFPIDHGLITNGSVMPMQRARRLVRHMTWVRVSLDAASAEGFRKSHGRDTAEFQSVLAGIRALTTAKRQLRSEYGASDALATVGIAYLTAMAKTSIQQIIPVVHLAHELGVDYVQFRPLLSPPHHEEFIRTTNRHREDLLETLKRAEAMSTPECRVVMSTEKYKQIEQGLIKRYARCHLVHFAPAVSASGNVSLCCHHMENDDFLIGNINEMTFADIWFGERKQRVITRLRLDECPSLCRGVGVNNLLDNIATDAVHTLDARENGSNLFGPPAPEVTNRQTPSTTMQHANFI